MDFNTSQQLTFTINWVLPINRRRGFSIWETFQHHSPTHTDWSNVSRLKFCDFRRPCGLIVQTNIMEQFFFIPMQSFYEEISRKKDSVSFIQRDCNWWYLSIITDRNISNAYFIRNFFIVFVFLSSLYNHLEKWWVLKGCAYNPPLPTPIHSPHPFPPLPSPIYPPHPVPPLPTPIHSPHPMPWYPFVLTPPVNEDLGSCGKI